MWRMFRDARILGIVGVLFFVVVIQILNATTYSAESFVLRYLTALEEGRGADVSHLAWGDGVRPDYEIGVPIDEDSRPRNPVILSSEAAGDTVMVSARVELAGAEYTVPFAVTRESSWSPLASWSFAFAPVATINITSTGNSGASINGVRAYQSGLAYYPSVATIDSPSEWFTTPPQSIVLDSQSHQYSAAVELSPSAALLDDLDSAVRRYLDECAAQKTLVPAECPFAGFTFERIAKGPRWTISSYPSLVVAHSDAEWTVTGQGKVRLRVSLVDFATEKTTRYSELIPFTISATVADLDTDSPRLIVTNTVER